MTEAITAGKMVFERGRCWRKRHGRAYLALAEAGDWTKVQ